MITQRPSELSDTCVSQCANFVILRTLHPVDLKYIKEMVPDVSSEIMLQLKNLKPGNCIAFGSAFKVPTIMYIDLPDPRPLSDNIDLTKVWYQAPTEQAVQAPVQQTQRFIQQPPQNMMGSMPMAQSQMGPQQVMGNPLNQPPITNQNPVT